MRTVFLVAAIIGLIVLFAPELVAEKVSRWQVCESDSDCITVRTFCNCATSVNKKYEDEFGKFVKSKEDVVECPKPCSFDTLNATKTSKCVVNACQLEDR